jgi:hypothetical protein
MHNVSALVEDGVWSCTHVVHAVSHKGSVVLLLQAWSPELKSLRQALHTEPFPYYAALGAPLTYRGPGLLTLPTHLVS